LITRVLLADDHPIMRQALRSLFEKESDIDVVGEAENGRAAVQMARKLCPDIVIMDVAMPDLNGLVASRRVIAASPRTKVLALSMHATRTFVEGMLKAGARGYVLKDCAFEELARAVRAVARGQAYLSPAVAAVLVENCTRQLTACGGNCNGVLTDRECEVLQLLAEGKVSKEIASHICVSSRTVDKHREHIMDKLSIYSIAGLTKYAVREGLSSMEA